MTNRFLQASGENLCVPTPTMSYVYDTRLKRSVSAQEVIGNNAMEAFKLRGKINTHRDSFPLFLCPECKNLVTLKMWKDQSGFFFSHAATNKECPIKDEAKFSRKIINARKYKGKKESDLHDNLKRMLEECLNEDPDFSNVKREKWWLNTEGTRHRQPDVQADYKNDLHVALEIQLSTTYSDVIADRVDFARQNKGILMWVVDTMRWDKLRTAFMDTISINNGNIFVFDDNMYKISVGQKKLHLKCVWLEQDEKNLSKYAHKEKVVTFDDLSFDVEEQWAYYFNFAENIKSHSAEVACLEHSKAYYDSDDYDFYVPFSTPKLSIASWNPQFGTPEEIAGYLGSFYDEERMTPHEAKVVINLMLSATFGHPHGWNFENNRQLFHNLYEYYKKFIVLFSFIEKRYFSELSNDDKVLNKKKIIHKDLKLKGSESPFCPTEEYDEIIEELFPRAFEWWKDFKEDNGL